jgi:hypothetical protein
MAANSVMQNAVEDMMSSGAFDEVRKAVSPRVAVSMCSLLTNH